MGAIDLRANAIAPRGRSYGNGYPERFLNSTNDTPSMISVGIR